MSFVNPSVDNTVNAAALKFMACGSITYHWQLNPFITTCDFSRVCVVVVQRVAGLPTKEYFFSWKVCGLTFIAMIQSMYST
jgi:hypothetical protein